jgi:hypothetical protein
MSRIGPPHRRVQQPASYKSLDATEIGFDPADPVGGHANDVSRASRQVVCQLGAGEIERYRLGQKKQILAHILLGLVRAPDQAGRTRVLVAPEHLGVIPEVFTLDQQDKITDPHLEPVLDVIGFTTQAPGIKSVATTLDIDQFRIGHIAETADHVLALDGHRDGPFQIGAILRRVHCGDEDTGHILTCNCPGPG